MPTLHIMVGMPGAGKTTWARKYVREWGNTTHVDTNQIRGQITGRVNEQEKNPAVFTIFYRLIERALADNRDVIADSTALQSPVRQHLREIAHKHGASTHIVLFTDPKLAWWRNERRAAEEIVPEHAMRRMQRRLCQTLEGWPQEKREYTLVTLIDS